jgi:hypothetical protein
MFSHLALQIVKAVNFILFKEFIISTVGILQLFPSSSFS